MGWVQGAGTPVGMIGEMLAAGLNSNCGGRDHIALDVERQIALWMAQAFGFPDEASGIFVTGASMANFLSLLVAPRTSAASERATQRPQRAGFDAGGLRLERGAPMRAPGDGASGLGAGICA